MGEWEKRGGGGGGVGGAGGRGGGGGGGGGPWAFAEMRDATQGYSYCEVL